MQALWRYRGFIWEGALHDLRHRYAGSSLGVFWNVLTPLAMLAIYAFIFTRVVPAGSLKTNLVTGSFVLYLACGFLPWSAFVDCVSRGAQALVGNAVFLKKMPIPEQVFVAESAVSGMLAMDIALALILGLALLLGQTPHPAWLLLPLVAVLWQTLGFGLGLLLGTLNVFFRDVGPVLGVVFQLWMWSLPVVYLEDFLPSAYQALLVFNPAYPFLRALRALYLEVRLPEPWIWSAMLIWAVLASGIGFLVLKRLQPEIRDVL
jgi:ABC-type polysaccharide/polyol phosphate export permease